jgi:hypothetical protein
MESLTFSEGMPNRSIPVVEVKEAPDRRDTFSSHVSKESNAVYGPSTRLALSLADSSELLGVCSSRSVCGRVCGAALST